MEFEDFEGHMDNILTCSICLNIIGNLKVILEKGLLESHKCFAGCDNIAIDFTSNVAYPESTQVSSQKTKPSQQPSLKQSCSWRSSNPTTFESNYGLSNNGKNQKSETSTRLEVIPPQEKNNFQKVCLSQSQEYWTNASIKLLISAYIENKDKFLSPMYNKKKVWECISETLSKNNVFFSGIKCDEKWRNLKKTYDRVLIEKKKTGGQPVFWEFFEDFHCIYVKDPRYEPVATASSSGHFRKRSIGECSQSTDENEKVEAETPKRKKKKEVLDLMEREQKKQQRHEEKMAFKREVLSWLKENFPSQKK